jgi:protein-disulfide isomerase
MADETISGEETQIDPLEELPESLRDADMAQDTVRLEVGFDSDTLTFKRAHVYAALIPLAFVVGLSVGFLFWGRGSGERTVALAAADQQVSAAPQTAAEPAAAGPAQAQAPSAAEAEAPSAADPNTPVQRYDIPLDDDPQLGADNAPITIVEFSDYECPYCQKFHRETFDRLLESYPDQIRFVYRDFPLASIHPNATPASEAANCANEQGAFWDYHYLLFDGPRGLNTDAYLGYAQDLSLDMAAFGECLDSRRYQDEVQEDFDFAARLGVRSTPTFFINGLPLVGAQPFEVFQQVIDKELAGEIP